MIFVIIEGPLSPGDEIALLKELREKADPDLSWGVRLDRRHTRHYG